MSVKLTNRGRALVFVAAAATAFAIGSSPALDHLPWSPPLPATPPATSIILEPADDGPAILAPAFDATCDPADPALTDAQAEGCDVR